MGMSEEDKHNRADQSIEQRKGFTIDNFRNPVPKTPPAPAPVPTADEKPKSNLTE